MNNVIKESIKKNEAAALRVKEVGKRMLELIVNEKLLENHELMAELAEKMQFISQLFDFTSSLMQKAATLGENSQLGRLKDEEPDLIGKTLH